MCHQSSPCYFLRMCCRYSYLSIHNTDAEIMPLSLPPLLVLTSFLVSSPSLLQSFHHSDLDSKLSFPVSTADTHPVLAQVPATGNLLILLVYFLCVLHISFPLPLLLCFVAAFSSFKMFSNVTFWDAFPEIIKWFLQLSFHLL